MSWMNLETEIPSPSWKWFIWDIVKAETGQSNDTCITQVCLQEAKTPEAAGFINIEQHYQVFNLKKYNSCVSSFPHAHTQRNMPPWHGISGPKQSRPQLRQGVRQTRVTTISVSLRSEHKPAPSLAGPVRALTRQDAHFRLSGSFSVRKARQSLAKIRRGKKKPLKPQRITC